MTALVPNTWVSPIVSACCRLSKVLSGLSTEILQGSVDSSPQTPFGGFVVVVVGGLVVVVVDFVVVVVGGLVVVVVDFVVEVVGCLVVVVVDFVVDVVG